MSPTPGEPPTLLVAGAVEDFVYELINKEAVPIDIRDYQPFSFRQLQDRAELVSKALLDAGYADQAVSAAIEQEGAIYVIIGGVDAPNDASRSIEQVIPEEVRSDVVLRVQKDSVGRLDALGAVPK